MRSLIHFLYLAVFLTGLASLLEEVLWARMLHRLLGSTSLSVATVLAGFLAGIALGGAVAQAKLLGSRRPLFVLGVVEILSGGCALALTAILEAAGALAAGTWGACAILLLLVGFTLPLGLGFPVLVSFLTRSVPRRAERMIPRFYGLNTLGAAAGAFLAAFVMISSLGEPATLKIAVGLQLAIGLAILFISRGAGSFESGASEREALPVTEESGWLRYHLLVFASGLVVLYWEVVWTRILVLVIGSSVYAFSMVTTGVLLGMGTASLCLGKPGLGRQGFWILPAALGWILVAAFFLVPFLADIYLWGLRYLGESFGLVGAGLLVLIPSFVIGAIFPWGVASVPRRSGSLLAVNSLGAALGAFLGGPLGARLVGLEGGFKLGVWLVALLTICGLVVSSLSRRLRFAVAIHALVLATVLMIPGRGSDGFWSPASLLSGVFQWQEEDLRDPQKTIAARAAERELLVLEEGLEVIVSVERQGDTIYVSGNGKTEGSVPARVEGESRAHAADLPTQMLLGLLPAILRPGKPAAVIGLGSGVTLGTAYRAGLRPIVGMEIEEAFLRAIQHPKVRMHFEPYVGEALNSGEVELVFGDARRLLLGPLGERRWSVIISQPSEPWISGSAALFTRQFFQQIAEHLEEDGLFVQWVQLYKMDAEGLRLLLRTFRNVFNRVFLLRPPATGELIVLGARQPIKLARFLEPLSVSQNQLLVESGAGSGEDLLSLFLLGPAGVEDWAESAGSALNTDERNLLEFRTPRFLHRGTDLTRDNLYRLRVQGGKDPIVDYLPIVGKDPRLARRLALRNLYYGDFWEARTLIADDGSPQGQALLKQIESEIADFEKTRFRENP